MNTITILVMTMWLHVNGQQAVTARLVVAPSAEACHADQQAVTNLQKEAGVEIAGRVYKIEKISGICLTFAEPKEV